MKCGKMDQNNPSPSHATYIRKKQTKFYNISIESVFLKFCCILPICVLYVAWPLFVGLGPYL